jgi:FAD:protein FMN transferase
VIALALPILLSAAALERFEAVEPHMGTLVSIRLYAPDAETAKHAFARAFQRIRELDDRLSDYRPDSEVNRLPTGQPVDVSQDLFAVVDIATQIAKETDGAFDVSIGALTSAWRLARKEGRVLRDDERVAVLSKCGYGWVRLDRRHRTVELLRSGMRLDLGGIAKGYAAQQALIELQQSGLPRALVAVSGDLSIGEAPPGRKGWRVEVAGGRVLELSRCGVSTSGDAEQHWMAGGRRYSHIVDPRTGMPLESSREVTVVADRSIVSDALATAFSIAGSAYQARLSKKYRTRIYLVP